MKTVHLVLKSWATWEDAEEVMNGLAGNPLIEFIDGTTDGGPS